MGFAWYLASMVRFCSTYVGMNDPTLLALAYWAAWALCSSSNASGRAPCGPGDVAHGPGRICETHPGRHARRSPDLALLESDHRSAARATLVGALGVAIGLALCTAVYGWAFVQQLFLYKRHLDLRMIWQAHPPLAKATLIAVLCTLLSTWRRGDKRARLVFVYVVASLVTSAVARIGDGVAVNSQFELILASAVGLAFALDKVHAAWIANSLGSQKIRWAVVAVLVATMLHPPDPRTYLFWISPGFHRATTLQAQAAEAEIARVRSLPGPAFCPTMSVCFRAGKSFVYDQFAMDQRVATGFWSIRRLEQARTSAGIGMQPGTEIGAWTWVASSCSAGSASRVAWVGRGYTCSHDL